MESEDEEEVEDSEWITLDTGIMNNPDFLSSECSKVDL